MLKSARYFSAILLLSPANLFNKALVLNSCVQCRENCGACCIAPSISSAIPDMPNGKPAGIKCAQLDSQFRCLIFGEISRPAVCIRLQPSQEMCGNNRKEAFDYLQNLEKQTQP